MAFNHFDYVPSSIAKSRSVFRFDKAVSTSAYLGYLYPMCKPVRMMPGSTLKLGLAMEIRTGALVAALMDELDCDVFAFNVPNRIVWEHWKQFLGAVDDVLFDNLQTYNIPSFVYGFNVITNPQSSGYGDQGFLWTQTIASHFELPFAGNGSTYANNPTISALPFRGYTFIWNEFFRPEQLISPILFSKGDGGHTGENMTYTTVSTSFIGNITLPMPQPSSLPGAQSAAITGGCILPVFRVHRSLWTSCLPKPSLESPNILSAVGGVPVGVIANASGTTTGAGQPAIIPGTSTTSGELVQFQSSLPGVASLPLDVVADFSQAVLTVNSLRETLLLQRYYDVLNRAGSRYDEIMRNLFHVTASDAVIDIPELIIHKRFKIWRNQVVATAETIDANGVTVNPVGSQSAYIDTIIKDSLMTTSTTEHGYTHLLFTIRPARIRMAQGIEPDWMQLGKLDQYYPQFDGMGDVARYKDEVYFRNDASAATNHGILGYQEYGAEWKYQRSSATAFLDPHVPGAVNGFNLVENITSQPVLVPSNNFDISYVSCWSEFQAFAKCLAVSSPLVSPQFVIEIRLVGEVVHPMPVYNIPGMGDVL